MYFTTAEHPSTASENTYLHKEILTLHGNPAIALFRILLIEIMYKVVIEKTVVYAIR
jgi:hypothetical protein